VNCGLGWVLGYIVLNFFDIESSELINYLTDMYVFKLLGTRGNMSPCVAFAQIILFKKLLKFSKI
jgi:hypothetical protein